MECTHPPNLVSADPLGCARHSLWAEVRRIGQYTSEHGRDIFRVLQTLNANLLSNASATLTLDRWCAAHKLAPEGSKIVAQRVGGQDKPADEHIRELLTVGPGELIAYRRVRLVCGDRVLSEATIGMYPQN